MIGTLDAARALLTQYGQQLHQVREAAGVSLARLASHTGIPAPYLSHLENGRYVPTTEQAETIGQWIAQRGVHAGIATELLAPVTVAHARMTDPVSSDVTVKSIAADGTLADKILACARSFQRDGVRVPFDDTDLTEALQDRWPRSISRPWQRNVIARARGLMTTKERSNPITGETWRVPDPQSALQRHGLVERTRNGRTRQTVHFVYREDNQEGSP